MRHPIQIFALFCLFLVACTTPQQKNYVTPNRSQLEDYLVFAKDAEGVGEGLMRLAPAHWDYIDGFAPALIARGPLLSQGGSEHRGSIHVLKAENAHAAERFAKEEPYYLAGFYSNVNVMS